MKSWESRPTESRPGTNSARGGRVLLIDPNSDYREMVCLYLDILGYPRPAQAEDGEQGLGIALGKPPELVIMEVRLPKLNGFEIVKQLRADPRTRDARILAATAMAMPGDREKCLAAGFDAYLAKPFTLKQLRGMLESRLPAAADAGYRDFPKDP